VTTDQRRSLLSRSIARSRMRTAMRASSERADSGSSPRRASRMRARARSA